MTRRISIALAASAIAALTIAAFAGAFGHAFLAWDDRDYVTGNPLVRGRLWAELLRAVVSSNFHPLTLLSLAANAGEPLSARPFLVTNVLLHALATVLAFALALRLSDGRVRVAAFTALAFGVHPMHVESVAWISERKDVLYAVFFLAAGLLYDCHLERRSIGMLALAFACFALSCLSKGMAVAFPGVMVMLDLWRRRPPFERRALLEKLPFVAVALLFGLTALDVQSGGDFHGLLRVVGGSASAVRQDLGLSAQERLALPVLACAWYVVKLFVPTGLCAIHPYPAHGTLVPLGQLGSLAVVVAVVGLAAWDLRRSRIATFGVGWFLVTVALVLQWLPVGGALVADRYSYVAYFGLGVAWGMGLERLLARRRVLGIALWAATALIAAMWLPLALRQVATWRDDEALWSQEIAVHPAFDIGYLSRGVARLDAGHSAEALDDFRAARRLGLVSAELSERSADAYAQTGAVDSAVTRYDDAIALEPLRTSAYRGRALAHLRAGQPDLTLRDLDAALAHAPADSAALLGPRGLALERLGRHAEAIGTFDRALAADPTDVIALYHRALCRLQLGDAAGAAGDLHLALRVDPGFEPARDRLAELEHLRGGRP